MKTHGHERREKWRKLPQVKPKKFVGERIMEKEIEKKEKEKRKKTKRKSKEGKEKKNEGECVIWERGKKKKGTTLPFANFNEPTVKTRRGKRQSWSKQRELRVGTRNYGFRRVPKGRSFLLHWLFLA